MFIPPIIPSGTDGRPGVSPWAGAAFGGIGMLGLLGMGLGRKSEPQTKREKAWVAVQDLCDLRRALESMTADADCLLGSEAQSTISPFNAETNAMVGEIALLRRRVLIVKSRLHDFAVPKIKESLKKLADEVDAAEASVTKILAMPDVSLEDEAEAKQASRDKSRVVQALSLPGAPHIISVIAEASGVPVPRADVALQFLVNEGLVEDVGGAFKWIGLKAKDDVDDDSDEDEEDRKSAPEPVHEPKSEDPKPEAPSP